MTYASKTLQSFAISCSLIVIACDTDPGDVGESAETTAASDSMSATSEPTASSTGAPTTTSGVPTTGDPSMSGTTATATTDGMSTTGDPGSSSTGSDTQGESDTGSDATTSTGTGDSGTGGTQVDDCSECEAGDVCVRYVAFVAESFCFPMPDACEDGIDCACGADFCNVLYDQCIEPAEDNTLNCECSSC